MLLAELDVRHTKDVSPTRRVALGNSVLPCDPAPGWGGVLLAGLVCASLDAVESDDELRELHRLIDDLDRSGGSTRITQPRLRYRFQSDVVGLDRSRHSLFGEGEQVWFDFDDHALPVVNLLGAIYAAGRLPRDQRQTVFRAIRKAMSWEADLGEDFVVQILGPDSMYGRWRAMPNDTRWALKLFGFGPTDDPEPEEITARFRDAIRNAHPDHGADRLDAGQRMVDLTQARKILLGTG